MLENVLTVGYWMLYTKLLTECFELFLQAVPVVLRCPHVLYAVVLVAAVILLIPLAGFSAEKTADCLQRHRLL